MENKVDLQCNKIFHFDDSMVMYGIYNSNTLEALIDTVHRLHTNLPVMKNCLQGEIRDWYHWYLSAKGGKLL